jgi:1,4-alpha-glucan branching enzyme
MQGHIIRLSLSVIIGFLVNFVWGQVVTSVPLFPSDLSSVTITFDATKGTGGLAGFSGEIYAHTGVITNQSASSTDWKYVKTNWGENTTETQLNKVDENKYELEIGPSIRAYYGVPADEEILKVALVFRSADASLEGKDDGGGDLFIELNNGFVLRVVNVSSRYKLYQENDSIDLEFITSERAHISYYVDGALQFEMDTNAYTIQHTVIADQSVHELSLLATTINDSVIFNHSYIVDPLSESLSVPEGLKSGINYSADPTRVSLVLSAPDKGNAFVLGDFNDWSLNKDYQMYQGDDYFWITLNDLEPGWEYRFQYLIDGVLLIADPYSEKIISQYDDSQIINENRYSDLEPYPANETKFEVSVLQTDQVPYDWMVTDFQKPKKEDLVIYELLVRDFTDQRTFQAVLDKLDYLDSLGINALELMPIMEFEGNLSWGYNPAFMMAVDKYYGTEQQLKKLIDACHQRGIAVIFDIVLNHHFGRNSLVRLYNTGDYGSPTADNPWLNPTAKHDYNVGYDFNHESALTQSYVDRVVTYWIDEFNIDGYRLDLSKGLTQKNTLGNVSEWGKYDASRVAILKRIADVIWEADPEAYVILEHFSENPEESELADYGMMLWGNLRGSFFNTAMGIASDIKWSYYKARGWNENAVVGYMESHDEERILFEVNDRSQETYAMQIKRLMQNAVFFFSIPGPKMIWQFGEFGYDLELNNDRLGVKPTKWEYLEDENRLKLFTVYQAMINLKTKTPYLDDQYFDWQSSGGIKWIQYKHPEVDIVIYGNFTKISQETIRYFTKTGTWYNYLTGQSVEVNDIDEKVTLSPGSFGIFSDQPIENYIEEITEEYLTGISAPTMDPLYFYPNPTYDHIQLTTGMNWKKYEVYNLTGQLMISGEVTNNLVDVAHLSPGTYLIKLVNKDHTATQKLIKN